MKFVMPPVRSAQWDKDVCLSIGSTGEGDESQLVLKGCIESYTYMVFGTSYTRFLENPVERFFDYKTQWEEETEFISSVTEIAMHPAYQKIIGMGEKAIPFILAELKNKPGHWFWALKSITGDDPVLPEDKGRIIKMTEAWLNWGKEKGYNF